MFNNIGKKIKVLASVMCILGIVLSFILGVITITVSADSYYYGYEDYEESSGEWGVGIAVFIIGSLLSWIGSFFMYGFGELIDQTSIINRKLSGDLRSEEQTKKEYNRNSHLETLRSQGIITEEEYQQAKQNNK